MTSDTSPCPECGRPLPAWVLFCPVCGSATPTRASWNPRGGHSPPPKPFSAEHYAGLLQAALGAGFKVDRLIGSGGFGMVFLAHDVRLKRDVAVKVLRRELLLSEGFTARFEQEAQALATLRHPGIVPVFSIGESDDLIYIVMPFIPGKTLAAHLKASGPLGIAEATRILWAVGDALASAHREGVVHRDVKPENILLDDHSQAPLLMDFGIAKATRGGSGGLTATGMMLGTPLYMSPEQVTGDPTIDCRSDIYSLAVVAFELYTGTVPFTGDSAPVVLRHHLVTPVPDPRSLRTDLPATIAEAVVRGMAKAPGDRFQTMEEFLASLGRGAEARGALPLGRRVTRALAATGLLVSLGAGSATFVRLRGPMHEVPITATIRASEVHLTLDAPQPLWESALGLKSLGVSGLDAFTLPAADSNPATRYEGGSLLLTAIQSDPGAGVVTLEPMPLPGGSALTLLPSGAADGFQLALGDSLPVLGAAVAGSIGVMGEAIGPDTMHVTLEQVRLEPGAGGVELEAVLAQPSAGPVFRSLGVARAAFDRIEKFREEGEATDQRSSAIVAGTVTVVGVGRPPHVLTPGEELALGAFRGIVSEIRVHPTEISLTLAGRVAALPRSLGGMPTEWDGQWGGHPIRWLAGFGAYLALLGGLGTWWRKAGT